MDWSKIEPLFQLCTKKVWNGGDKEWEVPMETFLPIFQTAIEESPDSYKERNEDFLEYVKNDSKVIAFDTIYVMSGRAGFKSEDRVKQYILRMA
jgi:hypothetical protein